MKEVTVTDVEHRLLNIDKRKTTDLCHAEHEDARCTRARGHEGQHECLYYRGQHTLRWG